MSIPCCLSGLPDEPLVDAEVWRYRLVLGTPAEGNTPAQPFDLTGTSLAMVLRARGSNTVVSAMATDPNWRNEDVVKLDGTITIVDAAGGVIDIVSDPWAREYRVPITGWGALENKISVRGDIMRLLPGDPSSRPEYLGFIQFPLRASTTQWPAPTS